MFINQKTIKILSVALNELVNGIGVKDIYIRLETEEEDLNLLWEKIRLNALSEANWSCEELRCQRNILCEVLRQLDSSEFQTRTGFTEQDFFSALIEIKDQIDSTC